MKSNKYAILVKNMSKDFVIYGDRPNTLKEKIIRFGKNKKEINHVLKNINLSIAIDFTSSNGYPQYSDSLH